MSATGGSSITLVGGTGNDTMTVTAALRLHDRGSGNNDLASSGGSSITLFGGTGNDSLSPPAARASPWSAAPATIRCRRLPAPTSSSRRHRQFRDHGLRRSASRCSAAPQRLAVGHRRLQRHDGRRHRHDSLSTTGGTGISLDAAPATPPSAPPAAPAHPVRRRRQRFGLRTNGSGITIVGGPATTPCPSAAFPCAVIQAGSGGSQIAVSGGSSITLFGGAGNDSIPRPAAPASHRRRQRQRHSRRIAGTSILLIGGVGNATLSTSAAPASPCSAAPARLAVGHRRLQQSP